MRSSKRSKVKKQKAGREEKRRQGIFSVSLRLTLFLLPLLSLFSSVSPSVYFFFPFLSFLLLFLSCSVSVSPSSVYIFFFWEVAVRYPSIYPEVRPSLGKKKKTCEPNSTARQYLLISFAFSVSLPSPPGDEPSLLSQNNCYSGCQVFWWKK